MERMYASLRHESYCILLISAKLNTDGKRVVVAVMQLGRGFSEVAARKGGYSFCEPGESPAV